MTPSYSEDHISQIPAIQLLIKMGYTYLAPDEALSLREGRKSNVILTPVLKEQLKKINTIEYKGNIHEFSDSNIALAINELKELPVHLGFINANQHFYDLITLGKSFEQAIEGDRKSFSFKYIDWETPENNVFHISEEFSVLRTNRSDSYRLDIVLFINGIPMVVIECKSNIIKTPIEEAISQHLRNQKDDGIRDLYLYSNLTLALAVNEAKYATTATPKEFWNVWKEKFINGNEEEQYNQQLFDLKQQPLSPEHNGTIFKTRYYSTLQYFNELGKNETILTEQDKLLYNICKPERLLELMFKYILFDDGIKKVARYQQYFAITKTLKRIENIGSDGKRKGGVIWHTQGSGKSLTMVMLAEMIALSKKIKNPKIILVTDRVDLNTQITETFQKCNIEVKEAATGKHLVELIKSTSDAVITTIINKFKAAVNQEPEGFTSREIFVLIDEGHRSQYDTFNVKMQKTFPNGCFIAFTGTPLMKNEKNTADKFGGIIDDYTIADAVEDKAVRPLIYEGRHNSMTVNEKPMDTFFDKIAESLTKFGKAELKRKYSSKNTINKADQIIYDRAWDISEHFADFAQGTGFKAQLVAPNKTTAIQYRKYLNEIGIVTSDVVISAPDTRENHDDAFEENENLVQGFYKSMMDKYGTHEKYEKSIINAFKKQEYPEVIIVVDKLLTGFDSPNNRVLYLTRSLKNHTLLQAIARVNRVAEGKDYGLIIDYYGNLENLDKAIEIYSGLDGIEKDDAKGSVTNVQDIIKDLPQAHSEVWDIFTNIKNKYDTEAYAVELRLEDKRHLFYEKLSQFLRLFKLAMSTIEFNDVKNDAVIEKYKKDAKFFIQLRIDVKRRYFDDIDYKAYEPQVQKLIDKHLTTDGEMLKITEPIDIFNKQQRDEEVEKITGKAAKADHIASRTSKGISIKMDDDPVFYKKLSELIKDTIEQYKQSRIDETEYLNKMKAIEEKFQSGKQDDIPDILTDNRLGTAYFNYINDKLLDYLTEKERNAEIALEVQEIILNKIHEGGKPIIDWKSNKDLEKQISNDLDDYFYSLSLEDDKKIPFELIDPFIEEIYTITKRQII
ncbi:type I restriction endonuclease subunit R [Chryseobacterium sp. L7]|uniref:Type I restriction enzyme endonuclease subunit n=1 Tax=Chryseobacterium endalhagicum TaxID=2797638 RepID=A0ABS1QCK5_9FLAO|nr:HsdR family type I site-specific deoxyribonuclease [Chryseobacterium endalhagicum]MBL1220276.1 type I restriction endonuclease subunit R [Chryseobacterium endalhagicum]